MSRVLFHPEAEQIELGRVLECLSDPVRRAIAVMLSDTEQGTRELRCRDFAALGGKTNLTYHFDKLREAGVIRTRLLGTSRYMQLRQQDLEDRFPNLLPAILQAAVRQSRRVRAHRREVNKGAGHPASSARPT